ncbi:hypothetical protein GUITHDRAFT_138925 [Guillardia theta CCMP2712]|uniref:PSP proline-rich domain-containing protein n=1 Tax=Guillardia theta (strain CCMP2712) TaxID=905079 RepID=L1J9Y1_GUITC|nr:hypothetical protein GUITHDRAFT_138925 [Guillardia theta CCMP2712]EKX45343.1 hypothetical protein GUITHDRAFT_138925 [Guillardia theta CCMP2712]|eukprot:XP_005832323.1 hypothetical protein GUITHDRAFT_138925 [Guillardia theta CCMP2712]
MEFPLPLARHKTQAPKEKASSNVCFNCGDAGELGVWLWEQEPRDQNAITERRKAWEKNKGNRSWTSEPRYFVPSSSERIAHVRPGMISERLREALGILPGNPPPYMRAMVAPPCQVNEGYPPGYVEYEDASMNKEIALKTDSCLVMHMGNREEKTDKCENQGKKRRRVGLIGCVKYPGAFGEPPPEGCNKIQWDFSSGFESRERRDGVGNSLQHDEREAPGIIEISTYAMLVGTNMETIRRVDHGTVETLWEDILLKRAIRQTGECTRTAERAPLKKETSDDFQTWAGQGIWIKRGGNGEEGSARDASQSKTTFSIEMMRDI